MAEVTFERSTIVRSTVARRCREYYLRRLERTENLQRRWNMCSETTDKEGEATVEEKVVNGDTKSVDPESDSSDSSALPFRKCSNSAICSTESTSSDSGNSSDSSESSNTDFLDVPEAAETLSTMPNQKSRSTLDDAMDHLRKEITSLIAQDNDLFRQLLTLNDSIAELKVQQANHHSFWDMDSDSEDESLESLSDSETTSTVSPASTLSSCSSHHLDSNKKPALTRRAVLPSEVGRQRTRSAAVSRTVLPSDVTMKNRACSIHCLRCHIKGTAPLYRRRTSSTLSLSWNSKTDLDSFDSGIHVHSDSDHEIFV